MYKTVVQVTCMLIIVTFLYDVLICHSFCKTRTYKHLRKSKLCKAGRKFLKKLRKAKRKYIGLSVWPSYNFQTTCNETVTDLESYSSFINDWQVLKTHTTTLIQEVVVYMGKGVNSFRHFSFLMNIMSTAKAGASLVSQRLQEYAETVFGCIAKIF